MRCSVVGFSGILRFFLESVQHQAAGEHWSGDVLLFSLLFEELVIIFWQAKEDVFAFLHTLNIAQKSNKEKQKDQKLQSICLDPPAHPISTRAVIDVDRIDP